MKKIQLILSGTELCSFFTLVKNSCIDEKFFGWKYSEMYELVSSFSTLKIYCARINNMNKEKKFCFTPYGLEMLLKVCKDNPHLQFTYEVNLYRKILAQKHKQETDYLPLTYRNIT